MVGTALPGGQLLLWDGETIYREIQDQEGSFEIVATGYIGDPAFIAMSPDNKHAMLGAGFGGNLYEIDTDNFADYTEETLIANISHFTGAYMGGSILLLDVGSFGEASELHMLDLNATKSLGRPVVSKSAKYALDEKAQVVQKPAGSYSANLFVSEVGLGSQRILSMDANTGELRSFRSEDVLEAFNENRTLAWETAGTLHTADEPFLAGGVAAVTDQYYFVNPGSGAAHVYDGGFFGRDTLSLDEEFEFLIALQPVEASGVYYSAIHNAVTNEVYLRVADFTPGSTIDGDVYRVSISSMPGGEGEGEGEVTLEVAAETLLGGFASADVDSDGRLSLVEAMATLSGITTTQFDALDQDSDGFLTQAELEAQVAEPVPGCSLSAKSLGVSLEELFLFGLTLLTLVTIRNRGGQ